MPLGVRDHNTYVITTETREYNVEKCRKDVLCFKKTIVSERWGSNSNL